MKAAIALLLISCMLMQCMAKLGVLGYYKLNKSYIATALCENRANKDSTCAGKCYLRKQMKRLDDAGAPTEQTAPKKELEQLPLFFAKADFSAQAFAWPAAASRCTPVLQHLRDTRTPRDIFHPPARLA